MVSLVDKFFLQVNSSNYGEEKGEQKKTEKGEKEKFGEEQGEQGTRNWRLELLLFSWVG